MQYLATVQQNIRHCKFVLKYIISICFVTITATGRLLSNFKRSVLMKAT